MSLLAESLAGAKYQVSTNDDRESNTNGAAEFLRRKRWPEVLLKELVGTAVFCLKPTLIPGTGQYQNGEAWGWKMIYASPSVNELLGQKASDIEGRDFFELVFAADRPQLQTFLNTVLSPPLLNIQDHSNSSLTSNQLGESHTTHIRMIHSAPGLTRNNSASTSGYGSGSSFYGTPNFGGTTQSGPVVWEIKGHATGIGEDITRDVLNLGAAGTVIPGGGRDNDTKHRAVWLMGRRVGQAIGDEQPSVNSFLELKLENERLQAELIDLQGGNGGTYPPTFAPGHADSDSDSPSSPSYPLPEKKNKPGRPSKAAIASGQKKQKATGGAAASKEGDTIYVCVTCGRTDSPEWRKGPLGAKTLCNACGLRWAKRNSTAQTTKKTAK